MAVSRFSFCRVIGAVSKTCPLPFRPAVASEVHERMSGCVEVLREMQERNAWNIDLVVQEAVPHRQDSGGSQTQPIAHG